MLGRMALGTHRDGRFQPRFGRDAEQQMEAKLIVVGGKAQAEEFELKLPTIVGRSRSADIPLNHPLVSRQHCELFESEGHLMVRDLGSLNGTFIGDSRVTAEAMLTPGGHLTIGSVTFEAVYEAEGVEADEAPDFAMEDSVPIDQTVQDPRRPGQQDCGRRESGRAGPCRGACPCRRAGRRRIVGRRL